MIAAALALACALGPSAAGTAETRAHLSAPRSDAPTAEQLLKIGEAAVEAGHDLVAAQHFEAAYEQLPDSKRIGPLGVLLVDEAVAARERVWQDTGDATQIEAARRLLLEHAALLEAGGHDERRREITNRLLRLDALVGVGPEPPPVESDLSDVPRRRGRSPTGRGDETMARKLKIAGAATMAGGAAVLVIGGGLGTYYAVQSQGFSNELSDWVRLQRMHEGEPGFADPADCENILGIVDDLELCQAQLEENEDTARRNGRAANRGAVLSFAVGGVLGIAGIATGAILYVAGIRREDGGRRVHLSPRPGGLTISGRF